MPLPVYWSSRFLNDYQAYLLYLIENHSLETAHGFDTQVSELIRLMGGYPQRYPRIRKSTPTRRALVNEYVYYTTV